ncbi:MAG: thioredoxin family protein [Bacteroidia bacterium]
MKWLNLILLFSFPVLVFTSAKTEKHKIEWLSLQDAQAKTKDAQKKIFVDLYTDWCGWCKVMDQKSFSHPVNVALMEKYFYAVKFNAEKETTQVFGTDTLKLKPRGGRPLHQFANKYGRTERGLSYPTTVIFDNTLTHIQTIPGYLDPPTLEKVLVYIGADYPLKGITWEQFSAQYVNKIKAEKTKPKAH